MNIPSIPPRQSRVCAQHPPASGTQILNVASGEETSIRTLAESVVRALGASVPLAFNGQRRAGDPANWRADVTRLRALGFNTAVPFTAGITRAVNWQKNS